MFYKIKNIEFESEGKTYFIKELNVDEQSNFKFNEFELMYGNKVIESSRRIRNSGGIRLSGKHGGIFSARKLKATRKNRRKFYITTVVKTWARI